MKKMQTERLDDAQIRSILAQTLRDALQRVLRQEAEDGQRVLPIPQLLTDPGFVEWVQGLDDDHGPLLFPDAAGRTTKDDLTGPFSKTLNRILDQLGLGGFDEDFYAMRKTQSSILRACAHCSRRRMMAHKRRTDSTCQWP